MRTRIPVRTDCDMPVQEAARLSLWPELLWMTEWAELKASPVYRGVGVEKGSGEPVIVVPGLRRWLIRIGYAAHTSSIGPNWDCPDVALEKLEERIEAVAMTAGQPVRIVGHSLGGMLARAAAVRRPRLVSQVITLGSPIQDLRAHPLVLLLARLVDGITPTPAVSPRRHGDHVHDASCACALVDALSLPFADSVERISIYSRRDGIVDWRSCLDPMPERNVAVTASHLGMLVNRFVYEAIAGALAEGRERRRTLTATLSAA